MVKEKTKGSIDMEDASFVADALQEVDNEEVDGINAENESENGPVDRSGGQTSGISSKQQTLDHGYLCFEVGMRAKKHGDPVPNTLEFLKDLLVAVVQVGETRIARAKGKNHDIERKRTLLGAEDIARIEFLLEKEDEEGEDKWAKKKADLCFHFLGGGRFSEDNIWFNAKIVIETTLIKVSTLFASDPFKVLYKKYGLKTNQFVLEGNRRQEVGTWYIGTPQKDQLDLRESILAEKLKSCSETEFPFQLDIKRVVMFGENASMLTLYTEPRMFTKLKRAMDSIFATFGTEPEQSYISKEMFNAMKNGTEEEQDNLKNIWNYQGEYHGAYVSMRMGHLIDPDYSIEVDGVKTSIAEFVKTIEGVISVDCASTVQGMILHVPKYKSKKFQENILLAVASHLKEDERKSVFLQPAYVKGLEQNLAKKVNMASTFRKSLNDVKIPSIVAVTKGKNPNKKKSHNPFMKVFTNESSKSKSSTATGAQFSKLDSKSPAPAKASPAAAKASAKSKAVPKTSIKSPDKIDDEISEQSSVSNLSSATRTGAPTAVASVDDGGVGRDENSSFHTIKSGTTTGKSVRTWKDVASTPTKLKEVARRETAAAATDIAGVAAIPVSYAPIILPETLAESHERIRVLEAEILMFQQTFTKMQLAPEGSKLSMVPAAAADQKRLDGTKKRATQSPMTSPSKHVTATGIEGVMRGGAYPTAAHQSPAKTPEAKRTKRMAAEKSDSNSMEEDTNERSDSGKEKDAVKSPSSKDAMETEESGFVTVKPRGSRTSPARGGNQRRNEVRGRGGRRGQNSGGRSTSGRGRGGMEPRTPPKPQRKTKNSFAALIAQDESKTDDVDASNKSSDGNKKPSP